MMRAILLLATPAMLAALPADAQTRENPQCERDRQLIQDIRERESRAIQEHAEIERGHRSRLQWLNNQIAEANSSGANPTALRQMRARRAEVIAQLNAWLARKPALDERGAEMARARLEANHCRGASGRRPWDRPATAAPSRPLPPVRTRDNPYGVPERPAPFPAVIPPAPSPVAKQPAPPANQYATWMTGAFDTPWGRTTLSPGGGTYEYQGGSIQVQSINGAVMIGKWIQTGSGGCPDKGHWGTFEFTFTATGFTGVFGHCGGPRNQGSWNGRRIR